MEYMLTKFEHLALVLVGILVVWFVVAIGWQLLKLFMLWLESIIRR